MSVLTPLCERVFSLTSILVDLCAGAAATVGPHKCPLCAKQFESVAALQQHLVCHAELRPFVCHYCDAGFTTSQSLKFHLRTHTQVKFRLSCVAT